MFTGLNINYSVTKHNVTWQLNADKCTNWPVVTCIFDQRLTIIKSAWKCQWYQLLLFYVRSDECIMILISNYIICLIIIAHHQNLPGRVAQSVEHLILKSEVLRSIPDLATYFRFSFRWFKRGSCQLPAKVCAWSTGYLLRRSKPAQEKCG